MYRQKYLKYKAKYIHLKALKGGKLNPTQYYLTTIISSHSPITEIRPHIPITIEFHEPFKAIEFKLVNKSSIREKLLDNDEDDFATDRILYFDFDQLLKYIDKIVEVINKYPVFYFVHNNRPISIREMPFDQFKEALNDSDRDFFSSIPIELSLEAGFAGKINITNQNKQIPKFPGKRYR